MYFLPKIYFEEDLKHSKNCQSVLSNLKKMSDRMEAFRDEIG